MLLDLLAEWPSGFSFCEREERKGFENNAYNSIQKKQRDQKAQKQLLSKNSTVTDLEKVFFNNTGTFNCDSQCTPQSYTL